MAADGGGQCGAFRFKVLVRLWGVPLHAHSTSTAQTVLSPSCCNLELAQLRDVNDDDDREFFLTAWCFHPRFIHHERVIFIPEPSYPGACEAARTVVPSLRYIVHIRLIAFQD